MKRLINGILAIVIIISSCNIVFADEKEGVLYEDTDVCISYSVDYDWGQEKAITLSIENRSQRPIENWQLVIDGVGVEKIQNGYSGDKVILPNIKTGIIKPLETIQLGALITNWSTDNTTFTYSLGNYEIIESTVSDSDIIRIEGNSYILYKESSQINGEFLSEGEYSNISYVVFDESNNEINQGKVVYGNTWSINKIGFDIGLNKLCLYGYHDGERFQSFLYIVNTTVENIKNTNIDIVSDSDDDGISDYCVKKLKLTEEMIEKIRKAKEVDQEEAILSQSEKITINDNDSVKSIVPDDPGSGGPININSLVIHKSYYDPGTKQRRYATNKYVADDLTYNDYTYNNLLALSSNFTGYNVKPLDEIISGMAGLFAIASLTFNSNARASLEWLIQKFNAYKYPWSSLTTSTPWTSSTFSSYMYSYSKLTSVVSSHSATTSFKNKIKNYVINHIKGHNSVYGLSYIDNGSSNLIEQYLESFSSYQYPVYNIPSPLVLMIHQWHGCKITLKNYTDNGTSFSGNLEFFFYDHFGLDPADYIEFEDWGGFIDWFALQHFTRFGSNYTPFIVTSTISVSFSGTKD